MGSRLGRRVGLDLEGGGEEGVIMIGIYCMKWSKYKKHYLKKKKGKI